MNPSNKLLQSFIVFKLTTKKIFWAKEKTIMFVFFCQELTAVKINVMNNSNNYRNGKMISNNKLLKFFIVGIRFNKPLEMIFMTHGFYLKLHSVSTYPVPCIWHTNTFPCPLLRSINIFKVEYLLLL